MSGDNTTTVDLSGAQLCIEGTEHYVESGELVAKLDYLRDARGDPQGILSQSIEIDVSLHRPGADNGDEPKVQHTEALELCNDLKQLQTRVASMYHALVLHYCATGVPSRKTQGKASSLRRQMNRVDKQLDTIQEDLEALNR